MLKPNFLNAADIKKLEEAMDAEDAEFLVATVDRIVELRLRTTTKPSRPDAKISNADSLKRKPAKKTGKS